MSEERQSVAEKVVTYLRDNRAFHNTPGTVIIARKLGKILGHLQPVVSYVIRRLYDTGIIILTNGTMKQGNKINPPHFVLAQGYEEGNSWKETLRSHRKSNDTGRVADGVEKLKKVRIKTPPGNLELAKAYTECLAKLNQASLDNNRLREELLAALTAKEKLEATVTVLRSEVDDLKASEHQTAVELMNANREIGTLTSQILTEEKRKQRLDRQIANFHR